LEDRCSKISLDTNIQLPYAPFNILLWNHAYLRGGIDEANRLVDTPNTAQGHEEMVMDNPKPVGQRISHTRQEKGLSVQALAERAGCSEEYLEWVEDGQVDPPVALLLRLAKAMQLDSGAFLHASNLSSKRLEEADKRTKNYSYQTLTPPEEDKHLMAFSVTIPPKTDHEDVGYRHEGEEYVYVLSGEVLLTVDQDKKRLAERESLRFNANLDHHLSNPGDKEAELLVILYVP
jgi:quercetin dioxygenase-like cupin family protein